jgi:DNA-binding transcriptional LysR family regulator
MELRHLKYFVAVAEEQNITRAATRLHVSQPPLSRQIRDLEEELGVALLERSAKAVKLTEAGRIFLVEAQAVLARADQAREAVRAFANQCTGELHVGYAPSLTVELLPHALREFQKTSPGVRVVLHDLSTEEMLSGLREKRLHLVLTIVPGPAALRGLEFQELRRYGVRVAVHPHHPWLIRGSAAMGNNPPPQRRNQPAGKESGHAVTWRDLAVEPLVGYSQRDYPGYHEWVQGMFAADGEVPPMIEEHDSASSLIAAVEAGRGVALVHESFGCFAGERVRLLLLDPPPAAMAIGAVSLKGKGQPAIQEFIAAAGRPAAGSRTASR